MWRVLPLGFAFLLVPLTVCAESLGLAQVFQDSMVLQQGVPIPVWGTADAGAFVTVTCAGQQKQTKANDKGKWSVALAPMKADSEPREIKVAGGGKALIVHDVLVGEVWVAAGQSNMEWPLEKEAHAKAELPKADFPKLRLLNLSYAGQNYFARQFGPEVVKQLTPNRFYKGQWKPCSLIEAKTFSAVGYYFAKELHQSLKVPVGIINLAVGGSPTEAWISRETLAKDKELAPLVKGNWLTNESQEPWCRQRGRENLALALKENSGLPNDPSGPNHPFKPGFLWEAGITHLLSIPVRGVIWYQGESNSLEINRVRQHERLFPLLVADWRKQWNIGEFSFLYCQLSSIGTEKGYKSQHWPEFRDGQRRMLGEIPNTGLAVTSDIGNPTDVHPINKKDVGHRLALWALAKTYDQQIVYSGPLAKSVQRKGSALVVMVDHAELGLKTSNGKPPTGFEIADKDGGFRTAEVMVGKNSVTLTNKDIFNPVSARYGWQPFSTGNLTNGAGLPASTFLLSLPKGVTR